MAKYLDINTVLAIHDNMISQYGGGSGIRDKNSLESAVLRPQTGYYADIIEEAAALWESLSQNHPFIDGNKRTAFAATATFLVANGVEINTDPEVVYKFIMERYADNTFTFDNLVVWIRNISN